MAVGGGMPTIPLVSAPIGAFEALVNVIIMAVVSFGHSVVVAGPWCDAVCTDWWSAVWSIGSMTTGGVAGLGSSSALLNEVPVASALPSSSVVISAPSVGLWPWESVL